jgi:protein FAM50
MSLDPESRFTPQNKTVQQRISSNTVGLVSHADFRKRRAEAIEQQEREAHEALASGTPTAAATPDRSLTGTPEPTADADARDASHALRRPKTKKRKVGGAKLSFGDDEDDEGEKDDTPRLGGKGPNGAEDKKAKFKPNSSLSVVPRAMTKSALRREAAEREVLRKEFLARQGAVRASEIAIPFVFYDGTNIPGGVVRVKKGDYVWVFLDKSRKVGADLGVGEKANARREWARVGVDDLMMIRGNIIIPHVSPISSLLSSSRSIWVSGK